MTYLVLARHGETVWQRRERPDRAPTDPERRPLCR